MKKFVLIILVQFCSLGLGQISTTDILKNAKVLLSSAVETVDKGVKSITGMNSLLPFCVEPPLECPNENITFWYYSNQNPEQGIELSVTKEETLNSLQKNSNPWKILIHGYTKSKDEIPNPQLRSAYFKRGEYNIISVDYEPIARDKCYLQAVHNVPLISNCTAQLIDALIEKGLFKSEDLHVIGFSLGAQVAGNLRDYLKNDVPNRVTGLDPASPLFDGVINTRINKDSGKFVDIIHTNTMFNGDVAVLGHVDFYLNGGLNQPGCFTNNEGSYSTCSHDRSPLYFAESINSPKGFWGIPCSNYVSFKSGICNTKDENLVLMGEDIPHTARGVYYLQTSDTAPFALGKMSKVFLQI